MRNLLLAAVLLAGCNSTEFSACDSLCTELVRNCSYEAFPTTESCMTGCAAEMGGGADIDAQEECILDAECDTFAIIECQNTFGSES